MKANKGVIHGRFQGLHHGHMEYLLEGKKRCNFLYIGISNPDPSLTLTNETAPSRSNISENPFTYFERMEMICEAMVEAGVNRNEFEVVPFPINYPENIKYYVPTDALFFVTIYDAWGEHKLQALTDLGFDIDIMWKRTMEERFTTGTLVRTLIAKQESWEHLVPKSVEKYIKHNSLDERLKLILSEK